MMTDLAATSDGQLRSLALYLSTVRDSWDRPGIEAALHAARRPGRSIEQLEHVALLAARDHAARTPAAILHADRWTKPSTPVASTPTHPAVPPRVDGIEPTQAWHEARKALPTKIATPRPTETVEAL